MSWEDFLYTTGITVGDLTTAQRKYWHGLWVKQYGPQDIEKLISPSSELTVQPPSISEIEITPQDEAGDIP